FDDLFVGFFGAVSKVGRNIDLFTLTAAAQLVRVGLHAHKIDDPTERFLRTDGHLHRNHLPAKSGSDRLHHALFAGALTIHAAGDDDARQLKLVGVTPDAFSDDFNTSHAIHRYQCALGSDHG